jgi:hypothetical protein
MLPATPTLVMTKSVSANAQPPRVMKNIAAVDAAPMARKTASSRFLIGV